MLTTRHRADLDLELAALTRQHAGVVHQRRLEHLGDQLRDGPGRSGVGLAVQHSHNGFSGDRMTLHLDDGQILKLSLLWPRRHAIAALVSVRWSQHVGWVLEARTAAGDAVMLYAWRARLVTHQAP